MQARENRRLAGALQRVKTKQRQVNNGLEKLMDAVATGAKPSRIAALDERQTQKVQELVHALEQLVTARKGEPVEDEPADEA